MVLVPTCDQAVLVDIFTKALPVPTTRKHCAILGLRLPEVTSHTYKICQSSFKSNNRVHVHIRKVYLTEGFSLKLFAHVGDSPRLGFLYTFFHTLLHAHFIYIIFS